MSPLFPPRSGDAFLHSLIIRPWSPAAYWKKKAVTEQITGYLQEVKCVLTNVAVVQQCR